MKKHKNTINELQQRVSTLEGKVAVLTLTQIGMMGVVLGWSYMYS